MLFMNEFLQQHWDGMRVFLQTVSSLDSEIPTTSFDGYVDLPLRLAVLHGLLVDIIYQRDQVGQQLVHISPQHLSLRINGLDYTFQDTSNVKKNKMLKGTIDNSLQFISEHYSLSSHPRLVSNEE